MLSAKEVREDSLFTHFTVFPCLYELNMSFNSWISLLTPTLIYFQIRDHIFQHGFKDTKMHNLLMGQPDNTTTHCTFRQMITDAKKHTCPYIFTYLHMIPFQFAYKICS